MSTNKRNFNPWKRPPQEIHFGDNEVHVWRAVLDRELSFIHKMYRFLTNDEKVRAEKFIFEKDRRRYIVARGLLRVILSRYLEIEPNQIRFYFSRHGRPDVIIQLNKDNLRFSLSHSSCLAVFAFTKKRRVGIDIEEINDSYAYEEVAERFLSRHDNSMIRKIPEGQLRNKAFFSYWTRQEAYFKARGEGLSLPLKQFNISLSPGEPAKLQYNRNELREISRWSFLEILPAPGFVSTLAVEGYDWRETYWEWTESMGKTSNVAVSFSNVNNL